MRRGMDLVSIDNVTREELIDRFGLAKKLRKAHFDGVDYPILFSRPRFPVKIALNFGEPSTRTKGSFGNAASELGALTDSFGNPASSSAKKGEAIWSTTKMIEGYHFDAIVMRHSLDGAVQWAADVAHIPVINGGDGRHEHPTQAELDLFTMWSHRGRNLNGVRVGYGGDAAQGRTFNSQTLGLTLFDNPEFHIAPFPGFEPSSRLIELLRSRGATVQLYDTVQDAICHGKPEFWYQMRRQKERENGEARPLDDIDQHRVTTENFTDYKGKFMHPLPIDPHVQGIAFEMQFDERTILLEEAHNGLFTRMALLYQTLNGVDRQPTTEYLHNALAAVENIIERPPTGKKHEYTDIIGPIQNGLMIDHIVREDPRARGATAEKIVTELRLRERGYSPTPWGPNRGESKDILKIENFWPSAREQRVIAQLSPGVTFNEIRDGKVDRKYALILCSNDSCVTQDMLQDAPPRFYYDAVDNDLTPSCRYCRSSLDWGSRRLTDRQKREFVAKLPRSVEPIQYTAAPTPF